MRTSRNGRCDGCCKWDKRTLATRRISKRVTKKRERQASRRSLDRDLPTIIVVYRW